jgi:hypothetical protein
MRNEPTQANLPNLQPRSRGQDNPVEKNIKKSQS